MPPSDLQLNRGEAIVLKSAFADFLDFKRLVFMINLMYL